MPFERGSIRHSVRMSWKPWAQMTPVEQHLYVAVQEQSSPWEATRPMRSPYGFDWPAVDPDECSEVLSGWLRAGLIGLYRTVGQANVDLTADEAEKMIADWPNWSRQPHPAGPFLYTAVGPTE